VKWRFLVAVVAIALLAAVRAQMGALQELPPSLVLTGHVDVAMGPDGRLLVLVDVETPSQPSDGLVDEVFRLQGAPALAYSGPATVTYVKNRLTVEVGPDSGWVFTVAGRTLPPPDLALTPFQVTGLAHMWGPAIHQSPATLFATLSSNTCSKSTSQTGGMLALDEGDPCKNCQVGGPGAPGCDINCGGGSSCEADCGEGSYACCSCPTACGCCADIEGAAAHH